MQVQSDPGTLAPYVPRALLARLARHRSTCSPRRSRARWCSPTSRASPGCRSGSRGAGQEGAEQLVDVINACFTALLADAYGRGGSLREVRRRRDAAVLLRRGPHRAGVRRGGGDAAHAARGRPHPRRRDQRRAADVGRGAQRLLPDVRGRRLASRALDRRSRRQRPSWRWRALRRRADRDQPANRAAACRAAVSAPSVGPGFLLARSPAGAPSGCLRPDWSLRPTK